ncbi:unnamed protein product, partial [Prorocentrum cordatum]
AEGRGLDAALRGWQSTAGETSLALSFRVFRGASAVAAAPAAARSPVGAMAELKHLTASTASLARAARMAPGRDNLKKCLVDNWMERHKAGDLVRSHRLLHTELKGVCSYGLAGRKPVRAAEPDWGAALADVVGDDLEGFTVYAWWCTGACEYTPHCSAFRPMRYVSEAAVNG